MHGDQFSLKLGIVLGHKFFEKSIEIDPTKVELIAKHPPPRNVVMRKYKKWILIHFVMLYK